MRLSIVVPVYNEAATVGEVLARVLALPLDKEVIVVDDGSTDGTAAAIAARGGHELVCLRLDSNRGKGAAIREALARAAGDYVLIQDADLELAPEEIPQLLAPVLEGRATVVYGSRFLRGRGEAPWANYLGNRLLTGLANVLYGCRLTDVSTAYKLFPRSLIPQLDLQCARFEFCPEITAKLRRLGQYIAEVPVTFHPRTSRHGKKLRYLRDGLRAAWTLLRWRCWQPAPAAAPVPCAPPKT
ncbi:MAG: glycosyltransferase family 2 protein [Armatimonadetes bacterium]|nr:glycosyltransferase family 2 protein [Armatimonadota bacterium]